MWKGQGHLIVHKSVPSGNSPVFLVLSFEVDPRFTDPRIIPVFFPILSYFNIIPGLFLTGTPFSRFSQFSRSAGNPENKAKQPESGDLCGNITEFGVVEGSPEPTTPNKVILPYSTPDEGCFYILLFNGFKSFQAKIYEINMYLLLYLFF